MAELINTHDQLAAAVAAGTIGKKRAVAVSYHARPSGRMGSADCSKAQVWAAFFVVAPKAPWYDYGQKSFYPISKRWHEAVEEAKEWASETFGIKEWKRNRFGDFVPAEVNDKHPIPKRQF